jgi:hypothetical protein
MELMTIANHKTPAATRGFIFMKLLYPVAEIEDSTTMSGILTDATRWRPPGGA